MVDSNNRWRHRALFLFLSALLAACGGGGGGTADAPATPIVTPVPAPVGGTGAPTPSPAASASLRFTPAIVVASMKEGDFANLNVTVKVTTPVPETLNALIVDSVGILDSITLTAQGPLTYTANLLLSQKLVAGQHNGSFQVYLCRDAATVCKDRYGASPFPLPYAIGVTPWKAARTVHKLLVSEAGVALASLPDRARLSRTLDVSDNLSAATPWSASSDQPWLSVTARGTAGSAKSPLTLTADASSLPDNTISYAIVSIKPDDAAVAGDSVVVGLWKQTVPVGGPLTFPFINQYTAVASDPVRPYLYAVRNGILDVFNMHISGKVASLTLVGATFGKMTVSPDGRTLYVLEGGGEWVRVFDLQDGPRWVGSWPLAKAADAVDPGVATDLVYARPNGVGIIITNNGLALRASDGKQLYERLGEVTPNSYRYSFVGTYLRVAQDGTKLFFSGSPASSPQTPAFVRLDYTEQNGGKLSVQYPVAANITGGERIAGALPLLVSADGSRVYSVENNTNPTCFLWNGADLSRGKFPAVPGSPACQFMLSDGRLLGPTVDAFDVFTGDGRLDQSVAIPSGTLGMVEVTSDALAYVILQTLPTAGATFYRFTTLPIRP